MVKSPVRRLPRRRVVLGAVAALLALALVAGFSATRPVPVTIDGSPHKLPGLAVVAHARESGLLAAPAGDTVSVRGDVLEVGGGQPPVVLRNGEAAADDTRIYGGDEITSRRGADTVESVEVTTIPIPFKTVFEGSGPLSELAVEGKTGERRVTRGALSGIEISNVEAKPPVNTVVRKVRPPKGAKLVALTFDDGPWPVHTEQVLDVLAKHEVKATFFVLGVRVNRKPDVARRIAQEGHLLGNHSLSHRSFPESSPKEVRKQIDKGREAIKKHTGVETNWLRPPYGAMDAAAWKVAKKANAKVVRWTVDSEDWRKRGPKKIADRVVKRVKPGAVVLFHDGGGDRRQTVKALPSIITQLKKKGYTFVTVEELYAVHADAKKAASQEATKKPATETTAAPAGDSSSAPTP